MRSHLLPDDPNRASIVAWQDVKDCGAEAAFDVYRSRVAKLHRVTLPPDVDPQSFSRQSRSLHVPPVTLHGISGSAHDLERDAAFLCDSPSDDVLLFRCDAGRVELQCGEVQFELGPGDLAWICDDRPSRSRISDHTIKTVVIPKRRAPERLRDPRLHGAVLRAVSWQARVVSGLLDALFSVPSDLGIEEVVPMVDCLLDAAANAFGLTVAPSAAVDAGIGLVDRARALITARIADPNLKGSALVEELGVSRMTLYRALSHLGGVEKVILNLRLDAARAGLMSRPPKAGLIRDIQQLCGFASASHFSRAFKARFGCPPKAFLVRGFTAGRGSSAGAGEPSA